jgi:site-specific recombinase XerD
VLPLDAATFVDTRERAIGRDQLQHLVGTTYRASGIYDRVARGALVHALRHTVATEVVAAQEQRSAAAGNLAHAALRGVSSPDGT